MPTIKELVFTGGKRISRERVLLSGHLKSGSHSASPLPTNYLYYADTLGNKIWDFHFGTNRDASYKMVQYDSTSFYCIVADEMNNLSRTDHINPKIYKIQISETGAQILWEQEHDIAPEDTNNVRATEVVDAKRTRDGGLILLNLLDQDQTGITPEFQHIKLMKIGPDGSLQWDYTYGTEHWDNPSAVIQTQDGGYAVLGTRIFTGGGGIEMFFDKFKSDGLTNLDPEETNSSNIQVQPSPVQDWLEVSLGEKGSYQITLYDLQGRVLWTDHAETHFASVQRKIPVTQLSSGIYLLQVQHEGAIWQKKILKQ
ncbi:MAG: T9SS type A sorting domain-containing protein [Bacteroidota bacterium]